MKLFLERSTDRDTGVSKTTFTGEVTSRDMETLPLNAEDLRVLELCGDSDVPADWLIGLELLFRKHHEMHTEVVVVHDEHPTIN